MKEGEDPLAPTTDNPDDRRFMRRALELAAKGRGFVEPNPMVGCVVVQNGQPIGEGWHREFGGPHAEVEALQSCRQTTHNATVYVTLEPCCHQGKTPPCADALIQAGAGRVVIAQKDPFPAVDGGGVQRLREAGIDVQVGVEDSLARQLNAPYLKLVQRGLPWVIAKWAMTLDGKIAATSGDSQWISSSESRAVVHRLRGCMDAIVVGRKTAAADDPSLTARPPGPRVATRVVLDSLAQISTQSRLAQTALETPTLVACGPDAPAENRSRLQNAGCQLFVSAETTYAARLQATLAELGRRRFTNVLIEGGGQLLGECFDAGVVDEVHVFVASIIVGGQAAPSPVAGCGLPTMAEALQLSDVIVERRGEDVYLRGLISR